MYVLCLLRSNALSCRNLNKQCQILNKCSNYARTFSTSLNERQVDTTKTEYRPIYSLPYIRSLSLVNRLKFYQTIITAVMIPGTLTLSSLDLIELETCWLTAAIGITSCLSFYGVGFLTNKIVGIIYYNDSTDTVKIAYIDFWGNRKDIETPARDIVPLTDAPVSVLDKVYLKLRRFSTKDTLRLYMKNGIILDSKTMQQIF